MNIIEAFNKLNTGEVVVDPAGGFWERDTNISGNVYIVKWPGGMEVHMASVPTNFILGEWRLPLSDDEVLTELKRGCVLKAEFWTREQIRMNPKSKYLEFRRNPNERWFYWDDAHIIMSLKWVIVEKRIIVEGHEH